MSSAKTTKNINIKSMLAHTLAKPAKGGVQEGYVRIYGDGTRVKLPHSYGVGGAYTCAYSTQDGGALIITPDEGSANHINKRHQLSVPAHIAKELRNHAGTHQLSVVQEGKIKHSVVVF